MAAKTCCDVATTPARKRIVARTKTVVAITRRPSTPTVRNKLNKARKLPGTRQPATTRELIMIKRKMEALRRLVPTMRADGAGEREDDRLDELLLHAAGYILRLQMQVKAMQVMVDVLNPKD